MSFCSWDGGEKYKNHFDAGIYVCSKCDHKLFSGKTKYEHSSPWPSFTSPLRSDSLAKHEESPNRLKVRCGKCNNGLGHEFIGDGPKKGTSRF